jgi:hypothetical protein
VRGAAACGRDFPHELRQWSRARARTYTHTHTHTCARAHTHTHTHTIRFSAFAQRSPVRLHAAFHLIHFHFPLVAFVFHSLSQAASANGRRQVAIARGASSRVVRALIKLMGHRGTCAELYMGAGGSALSNLLGRGTLTDPTALIVAGEECVMLGTVSCCSLFAYCVLNAFCCSSR